jgi:hypothetical protein
MMRPRIQTTLRCLVPVLMIVAIVLPARSDLGIAYAAAKNDPASAPISSTSISPQTVVDAHSSKRQCHLPFRHWKLAQSRPPPH